MDLMLKDKLPREMPGLGKQHCTSRSQRAGSTILGAKVTGNQDAETKLQLFSSPADLASGKEPHHGLAAEGKVSPVSIQARSYSVPSSPSYLCLLSTLADLSWTIPSPEVTLNLRDSAFHLKLNVI